MSQIGPGGILLRPGSGTPPPQAKPSTRFELKIHDITPEEFEPNGDRYIVEIIDIDETKVMPSQLLVVTQDPNVNPRDPAADPRVEARGVIFAVVLRAGNGHLLGIPDWANVLTPNDPDRVNICRTNADVPMFYKPGDVVCVDRNARGRNLRVGVREVRVVNQIDVLCRIEGVRLVRDGDSWTQE